MGANDTNFFPGAGHGVRVTDSTYQAYAMGFRVGASPYVFTGLRLPLLNLSGIDNLIVSLRQDAAMGPGNVVEILSKDSPVFPDWPAPVQITSLLSSAFPMLAANSVYWITLEPSELSPCWYSWAHLIAIPEPQILAYSYNTNGNTPLPWNYSYGFQNGSAFAVYGTPVPEASASLLGVFALTSFVALRIIFKGHQLRVVKPCRLTKKGM